MGAPLPCRAWAPHSGPFRRAHSLLTLRPELPEDRAGAGGRLPSGGARVMGALPCNAPPSRPASRRSLCLLLSGQQSSPATRAELPDSWSGQETESFNPKWLGFRK